MDLPCLAWEKDYVPPEACQIRSEQHWQSAERSPMSNTIFPDVHWASLNSRQSASKNAAPSHPAAWNYPFSPLLATGMWSMMGPWCSPYLPRDSRGYKGCELSLSCHAQTDSREIRGGKNTSEVISAFPGGQFGIVPLHFIICCSVQLSSNMTQTTALPRASLGAASRNLVFLTAGKHFLIFSLNFPFLKFILFTSILRPHPGQLHLLRGWTESSLGRESHFLVLCRPKCTPCGCLVCIWGSHIQRQ